MCPLRVRSRGRDAEDRDLAPDGDRWQRQLPLLASSAAAAVLILGPVLGPGFLLRYDMVFVPRQPLTWGLLGLDSQTPRAVPSDLAVALVSHVIPGGLAFKVLLVALLVIAGVGAGRVLPLSPWGSAAAGVAYVWTPFVGERLLIGQWAVLIGYAALPWVVRAAARVARGGRGWPSLFGWLALGSLGGGATWVLVVPPAFTVMLVMLVRGGRNGRSIRRLSSLLVGVTVTALPWAVPALTRPGGVPANAPATSVFAPSPDTGLGTVGSLLTGGGIWNADAVPPGRHSLLAAVGALVILLIAATGWLLRTDGLVGENRSGVAIALLAAGGLGLALALSGLVPPVARALAGLPGGGLLRDSQRLLAPWCLLVAVGVGLALPKISARLRVPAVYAVGLLPVAVLPSLAWGVSGHLRPVDYPADYSTVQRLVDDDPRPGAVLILPFQAYRRLAWNHGQTSMSAVPRWVDRTVVVASDLRVRVGPRTVVVPGEDRLAARAAQTLSGADPAQQLGRLGIRWVVQDAGAAVPTGLSARHQGPTLSLYEVPDVDLSRAVDPAGPDRPARAPVLAGDLGWVVFVLGALVCSAWRRRSRLLLFGNRSAA
jgi:hypothetical protein